MKWLESIDIDGGSGKEALQVLISECKNLRASILEVTKQITTTITNRQLTRNK